MALRVYQIDPLRISESRARESLTAPERDRAARFRFQEDRVRWIACRAALRGILAGELGIPAAEVPLGTEPHGKPCLPPEQRLFFNLSHCHDLALVAVGDHGPLGIDLEPRARASELDGCEETFLHPQEIADLPPDPASRHMAMLEIWTAKEAFLKALGTGLSYPPTEVIVDFATSTAASPGLPALAELRLHRLDDPGLDRHLTALACPPAGEITMAGSFRL